MASEPEDMEKISNGGVDAVAATTTDFSWTHPHVIFVVLLVGGEETPFGIQKDFLCSKSSFYRRIFSDKDAAKTDQQGLELVVKLPHFTPAAFGLVQNFLFTGELFTDVKALPGYEVLIDAWKLGNELDIDGLCNKALEAMDDCRRITQHIPATPLLVQAWQEAPDGSSIRKLLLSWAAEYIRSSESRQEFTKSLPQEVLSELVIAMSNSNSAPVVHVGSTASPTASDHRKNVHYAEPDDSDDEPPHKARKARRSELPFLPERLVPVEKKAGPKKPVNRASLSAQKPVKIRRTSNGQVDTKQYSDDQKLNFCADLLTRMLSGPGFWTRLVGPFREPVRPIEDGVPDYLDKVKKPMDLGTIKTKMDRKEYDNEQEFLADVRLIFSNCFTYHQQNSPMWMNCEKFQKTFEEKFATMPKWISKLEGDEAA
ncbi:Bromodomain-containing protein [Hypoxylon crocopeplum]|nr:Bromodomain-containing protein [Hypoxylon crocopeplum]